MTKKEHELHRQNISVRQKKEYLNLENMRLKDALDSVQERIVNLTEIIIAIETLIDDARENELPF